MPRTERVGSAAVGLLLSALLASDGATQDIAPLPRYDRAPLDSSDIFNAIEHWYIGTTRSAFRRTNAADSVPSLCALTLRAMGYYADPALESVQIGVERFPATSRPDALDGTMFLRVRFADTATWRAVPVEGLIAVLDRTMTTESWRVDPIDAEGYMTISRPTARATEDERKAFGWMAADGYFAIRIARATGVPIRQYRMVINRVGFIDEAVFDMIDCLKAMGEDPVTFGAVMADERYALDPVQVPPSRLRR
jgi:hypothetical protein